MAPTMTITNVLGETRAVGQVWEDGSYTCPFCGSAVMAEEVSKGCPNPACDAGRWASRDRALEARQRAEERRQEAADRERRAAAMRASMERWQAKRAAAAQEARAAGYCMTCWSRSGGRRTVRHRSPDFHQRTSS